MTFQSIDYAVEGRVATITLDRPDCLNAIDDHMPAEIGAAVRLDEEDKAVQAVVATGAGRAFSSGYDLEFYAENPDAPFRQSMPWDPVIDYAGMSANTQHFMSLWRCHKPTIAKVRGYAVAGAIAERDSGDPIPRASHDS